MARFAADADVLAADLLVGGPSREALDLARGHDWIELVASERVLADAGAIIETLAADSLAAAWRDRIQDVVVLVSHPSDDHPGLASAVAGDARHLLTLDDHLASASANVALADSVALSVRRPESFLSVFDVESMYDVVVGGTYPGPDRDPRA
ncbi:MAG: hypothetical protein ABEJ58_00620 [Halodesulfurarchaeum sp.]